MIIPQLDGLLMDTPGMGRHSIPVCDSEELFGVCPLVFLFILKGFPHKFDVLHFCIYFSRMGIIHVYR